MYQEYLNQLQVTLSTLSTNELNDLLNNDEKVNEKVEEVIEPLKRTKDNLFAENRSKAESNIEKEPLIIELRSKRQELLNELKERCESVQDKLTQIKEKPGSVNQETALALLQTAAAESEEETENLLKQFTDNECGVEAFLEGFLAARKTMHLRKLKAEKMQELIRQAQNQQRGMGAQPTYSNLPNSNFYPTQPSGMPYPMVMPMPRPY